MTPANGALISVLANLASASATAASASRRLFSASSLAWAEMKPCFCRPTARSYLLFARVWLARACFTSASLMAVSRRTSGVPRATRWPSLNRIAAMRPATSGRTMTDSSERRLPTAVIACGRGAVATLVASTVTACAPLDGPPPLADGAARHSRLAARRRDGSSRPNNRPPRRRRRRRAHPRRPSCSCRMRKGADRARRRK